LVAVLDTVESPQAGAAVEAVGQAQQGVMEPPHRAITVPMVATQIYRVLPKVIP
jgi:hypothetical protein